jgi:hypothetical protein
MEGELTLYVNQESNSMKKYVFKSFIVFLIFAIGCDYHGPFYEVVFEREPSIISKGEAIRRASIAHQQYLKITKRKASELPPVFFEKVNDKWVFDYVTNGNYNRAKTSVGIPVLYIFVDSYGETVMHYKKS